MEGLYILLGVLLLIAAGTLVLYFVRGFALYRMACYAGLPHPLLAFVPVAGDYLLGLLCQRAAACHGARDWRFPLLLPLLRAVGSPWLYVLLCELLPYGSAYRAADWMFTSGVQAFFGFFAWAFTVLALYHLFWDYAPGQQDIYTVLSVVLPEIAPSVCLFLVRQNVPLSAQRPGRTPPPPVAEAPPAPPPPPRPWPEGSNKQGKK